MLETRRRLRSSPSSSPLISQDHNETLCQRNGPSQRSQILQGRIPERQSRVPFVTFAFLLFKFLCCFCPPSKTKPAERYSPKREFVEGPSRNANPVGLCYLCFLLFKFLCLLLSAVKDHLFRGKKILKKFARQPFQERSLAVKVIILTPKQANASFRLHRR